MVHFYSSLDGGHREVRRPFRRIAYLMPGLALHNPSKIDYFEETMLAGISISQTHH